MTARTAGLPDCQSKRCPFGREIEAKIGATGTADVRLYASEPASRRWSRALARRALVGPATATLLPPSTDPLELRWPACPIVADVTGLPGDQVHALAQALIRDGCEFAFLTDLARGHTLRVVPQLEAA